MIMFGKKVNGRQTFKQSRGTCSTQIGAGEEIGSGSANGVEEEEGTSTLDCRAWSQEEKYRDDANGG